jgi:class 3 adenylate cyclase
MSGLGPETPGEGMPGGGADAAVAPMPSPVAKKIVGAQGIQTKLQTKAKVVQWLSAKHGVQSEFLLKTYVTPFLRFDSREKGDRTEDRFATLMTDYFHRFFHNRFRFFSSLLHPLYGLLMCSILMFNGLFGWCVTYEKDFPTCTPRNVAVAVAILLLSLLSFAVTRTEDYVQATKRVKAFLHAAYFLQGVLLAVVEVFSPFPKYFRVVLHFAFGYSFFPLVPRIMLMMNVFVVFLYALGCGITANNAWANNAPGISLERLLMNYLVLVLLLILQATAQYNRHFNIMCSELAFEKSKYQERKLKLEEKKCSELLTSMLPVNIVKQLISGGEVEPEYFENVTVIFAQFCDFSTVTADLNAGLVVELLNELWSKFDLHIDEWGLYKIETVGEIYLCVAGCPIRFANHPLIAANMALGMQEAMGVVESLVKGRKKFQALKDRPLQVRVGLNSGPIRAGVVGIQNPRYKMFGDTVNTASRMESTCPFGKIQMSDSTYTLMNDKDVLSQSPYAYEITPRGAIDVKGKGKMNTYLLLGKSVVETVMRTSSLGGNVQKSPSGSKLVERSSSYIVSLQDRRNSMNKESMTDINAGALLQQLRVAGLSRSDSVKDKVEKTIKARRKSHIRYMASKKNPEESTVVSINVDSDNQSMVGTGFDKSLVARIQRFCLMISDDDESFNPALIRDLQRKKEEFVLSRWSVHVRLLRMVASGAIVFTSVIAWNQYRKRTNNVPINELETPAWFGLTVPLLGLYIFATIYDRYFRKWGRVLTWVILLLLLFVFTFTCVYILKDGTLVLVVTLVSLNVQIIPFSKRALFAFFGLVPYSLLANFLPPSDISAEGIMYRSIWGDYFTYVGILFLQFFPLYANEYYQLYSSYQKAKIEKSTKALSVSQEGTLKLLENMLPFSIAQQIMKNRNAFIADTFEDVTILFTDIKGFTSFSQSITPGELVEFLNNMYSAFDEVLAQWDAYKVEILGDAYFVVCGCPDESTGLINAANATEVALLLQSLMPQLTSESVMPESAAGVSIQMRCGLHSGEVVAGVVGKKDPRYHLFGRSVVFANKMESHGVPGKVHISSSTYERLLPLIDDKRVVVEKREPIEVQDEPGGPIVVEGKEVGHYQTYFVSKSKWGSRRKRQMRKRHTIALSTSGGLKDI